ncbi:hypothetical protein M378DRAFT_436914 [Amanita muscaria Koide BX008]|uniref:Uncharacterized protein n=1 Tax=Amanita muscaria (strain Koide BX008) TaxID=946122 RepID=A0A0C2W6Q5_AMAMK|nr:hypothetical protein M378DRAFT_436914 [Amanita muscaria Koide BX008]
MPHHTTSKNTIIALLGSNLLLAAISAMYTRITERAEVSPKRSTPSSSSNLKYKTSSSSRFPLISTFLFLFEPGYYITNFGWINFSNRIVPENSMKADECIQQTDSDGCLGGPDERLNRTHGR